MKKIFVFAFALVASVSAMAQKTVDQYVDYTGFKNVEINNNFEVKLCYSEAYSVKITVDERIAENVIAVVKSNTLVLDIDEKGYSKELKQELKAKNAIPPVVIAEVYAPTFSRITLSGKASVVSKENLKVDDLTVEVGNAACVKNLAVDGQAVKVKLSNKASGRFDLYCKEVEYSADNSASSTLVLNCSNFIASNNGSSVTTADGDFKIVEINSKNSSSFTITGGADKLCVTGSGSSTVNSDGLTVMTGEVSLSNSALCKINAKKALKVELLNSSHLIYNSNPVIEVDRIVGSTMTKSSDTKYNKGK